jgi:hypothetical protein
MQINVINQKVKPAASVSDCVKFNDWETGE